MSSNLTLKRATRIGAALAAASLALTACGSSDNSSDNAKASGDTSSSSSSSSSSSKLTGDPIKIGYVASTSGSQSQNGLVAKGVSHAWAEYANANGGILGHPVEVDLVDSKTTVPGATAAAQGFLKDNSVDAIFMTDLVAEGALNQLFANTPVAVISGGGSADSFWENVPGAFQDVTGSNYVIKGYVDEAKAGGAKNIGWAACAEVASCSDNGAKADDYIKSIGLTPTGIQQISATANDYTAQCLAWTSKGTDGIALSIGYPSGARLASDCMQQGYSGIFSTINSSFDQATFSKVSGFKTVGGSNGFPWWTDDPQVTAFRDAMKQYSPDAIWQSGNATAIWSSFELLKKALENAKPSQINRSTVMDAMYNVKNETLGGLLPEAVTYTKGQPSKPINCNWTFKFNAGDDNPTSIPSEKSGNGASGDMASTCSGYLPGFDPATAH